MKFKTSLYLTILLLTLSYCTDPYNENSSLVEIDLGDSAELTIPDWTKETHSNDVDPNYDVVFEEGTVKRIDITISEENWQAMQNDLSINLSASRSADVDFTPIWVPTIISFEGKDWYKVGIRYKGNSTLRNAYSSNTDKYPFKLDFDEFEDDFPVLKNQRFYGFKQLNLNNNNSDGSFMREKLAADLFREFGVPAARTAFYAVYLNRGSGETFIGLYTLIEEVDDSVMKSQFNDDSGNLYKPDGDAATFAPGTVDESEFDLKTNEEVADFTDVQQLYDVLNHENRTSNTEQWQDDLEQIFNIDGFLKYLAVNNVIQNWDTYGVMTHNYFLYNNSGLLTWIPWDNNESFQEGKQGGAVSLSMSEVGSNWPLIRYIMDVDEYYDLYQNYVGAFTNVVFNISKVTSTIGEYESFLESYANQESYSFESSVRSLEYFIENRYNTAKTFSE
jgi:spore coat protein CotH